MPVDSSLRPDFTVAGHGTSTVCTPNATEISPGVVN